MKEIKLTQGRVALVDDRDFDFLNRWKWRATKNSSNLTFYASRRKMVRGKRNTFLMHRLILNTPSKLEVDHVDGNGLNNQRYNIRNATRRENAQNRKEHRANPISLGTKKMESGKYQSQIWIKGVCKYLGVYDTQTDAYKAFKTAEEKHYG